jgi:hypothetical protein
MMAAPIEEVSVPQRAMDTPKSFLRAWSERTGLPASLLSGMSATIGLFGLQGLPAFGAAVLALLSGSSRAVSKMREFEGAVEEALRDLGFRMDLGAADMSAGGADALAERISLLQSTLSGAQTDQLGVLFEDYLRSSNAEYLEVVRRAVRAVVKDAVDEGTRRTVLSRLPSLSMAHLRELQRIKDRPDRSRTRLGVRSREPNALHVVLLNVGFVREVLPGEVPDAPTAAATVRMQADAGRGDPDLRPTALGLAAIRLLGPIELTEGRS